MAGRRANGEGTIYRRRDGRYEGAVYLMTTGGRSKRAHFYGSTRVEVHDKLTEAKRQAQQGILMADQRWRLGDYLDYWLGNVVAPNLRATTSARYSVNIRLYIKPTLGKYLITQLSVPIVQSFLNDHLANGHSVRSAQIVRTVLSSALTRAQREELVARNVARLVELPTYERADVVPWTEAEVKAFLYAARSDQLSAAFLLLSLYGLRRGEVLGIRWQDVDVARGVVRIRQQVVRIGGVLQTGPVKTKAGRRDLPLLDIATRILTEQQKRQATRGEGATGDSLVFTTSSGRPVDPDNFARSFRRLCRTHGLRPIKLHHVRHTMATMLKDKGVSARDAQLILGHSNLSTTQEIYQHDNLESRRAALGRIEGLFCEADSSTRCRQQLPSGGGIVDITTSSISGSSDWDRTSDLRLMRSISGTLEDRLTSVRLAAQRRTTTWLLGCVAVKLSRQLTALRRSYWRDLQLPRRESDDWERCE